MKLFTPIQIGNLTIKNRLVMAPMENGLAEVGTGEVTQKLIDFFVERVKNDVSMIFTGSIGVSPEGRGLPTQLSLYDHAHVAGHKKLVDAIHKAGGKIAAQIYHAGRQASEAITGLTPLAPSAMPCAILSNHPKEISLEEMEEVKNKFVQSALWAIEAGYDLIEVHFAHGYLLHSFLSPHSNHRNDEYNGSLENRMKYPMYVLKSVIEAVDNRVPVTIRISADEYLDDGLHFDEVKVICKECEKIGCKAISVTAGSYDSVDYAIQPMYIPQGFLIPYAKQLKQILNIPVMVAARLNNANLIINTIENDDADIVCIGRGLIADPMLAVKLKNNDLDNIRYCLACNQGCIDRVLGGMGTHCMVNPCAGEEATSKLKPIEKAKNVAVIGAGPAGIICALTLKQRGHNVTIYNKGNFGGKLDAVMTPPEKDTFNLFKEYLLKQVEKNNLQIIDKEIKSITDLAGNIDTVVLATGSKEIVPHVKGLAASSYYLAEDLLNNKLKLTGNVVIIGGGLVGTETAKYLAKNNAHVTIVEMKDSIANGIGATYIGHLYNKISEYNINVLTKESIKEVTPTDIITNDEDLKYDHIVIAAGYKPCDELEDILNKKFKVVKIGDALQPRRILDAVFEGYKVGNEI